MKEFEIWVEGYSATGEHSPASFIGKSEGEDFFYAVKNFIKKNKNTGIEFRDGVFVIWGCRLFDNEADARKSFG